MSPATRRFNKSHNSCGFIVSPDAAMFSCAPTIPIFRRRTARPIFEASCNLRCSSCLSKCTAINSCPLICVNLNLFTSSNRYSDRLHNAVHTTLSAITTTAGRPSNRSHNATKGKDKAINPKNIRPNQHLQSPLKAGSSTMSHTNSHTNPSDTNIAHHILPPQGV